MPESADSVYSQELKLMHRVIVFSRVELTGLKGNRVTILKEHSTQTYYRGISVELKFRIWSCVGKD